ncbi:unnamed protein product, partial [Symbiodinium natans]
MRDILFSLVSLASAGQDTVVPSCRTGYQDITGGKAYSWSCAHHCVGGPNFATENCGCACLSQDQIQEADSGTALTTARIVGQAGEILVTSAPPTDVHGQLPVQELPVGELQDGGPVPDDPRPDNFEAPSRSTTEAAPAPEESGDLRQVLMIAVGLAFLLIAASTAATFAYRRGMLPCKPRGFELKIQVAEEECPEPGLASRTGPRFSLSSRGSGACAEPGAR